MEKIISPGKYLLVTAALLTLLAATAAIAEIDLGDYNVVVALVIAFIKAALVILIFMEVRYSSKLTRVLAVAGFFWLGILILFTLTDVLNRTLPTLPG